MIHGERGSQDGCRGGNDPSCWLSQQVTESWLNFTVQMDANRFSTMITSPTSICLHYCFTFFWIFLGILSILVIIAISTAIIVAWVPNLSQPEPRSPSKKHSVGSCTVHPMYPGGSWQLPGFDANLQLRYRSRSFLCSGLRRLRPSISVVLDGLTFTGDMEPSYLKLHPAQASTVMRFARGEPATHVTDLLLALFTYWQLGSKSGSIHPWDILGPTCNDQRGIQWCPYFDSNVAM